LLLDVYTFSLSFFNDVTFDVREVFLSAIYTYIYPTSCCEKFSYVCFSVNSKYFFYHRDKSTNVGTLTVIILGYLGTLALNANVKIFNIEYVCMNIQDDSKHPS
jgi:hypothetical protein